MNQTWIITEKGLIGTQNQALGVAEALKVIPDIKEINLRQPWKTLSPYIGYEQSWSFSPPLTPPWPSLLITGGRKAIAACHHIKRHSPSTFIAFLQNPKTHYNAFDLIAAPIHDNIKGPNIIQTIGAPNRITHRKLEKQDTSQFDSLSNPKIAVLLGGKSKTHRLTDERLDTLINQLQSLKATLLITPSRRTEPHHIEKLQAALPNSYIWDGTGDNPYLPILAAADHIFVTGDSVSMLSDAGTTGKPVYIIPLEGGSPKFDRFYSAMFEKNIARLFEGKLESWNYTPLNDAQMVANEIKKRMKPQSS